MPRPVSASGQHGSSSAAPLRVPPTLRAAAAQALMRAGGAGDAKAGRRFVEAARIHAINLENFWAVMDPATGRALHACLLTPGAGRTATLFLSPAASPESIEALAGLIRSACAGVEGPCLAQALLEPADLAARKAVRGAGFTEIGPLLYMRRRWTPAGPGAPAALADGAMLSEGAHVRAWRRGDEGLLAEALEASYEQTMDCPELHGLRDTADVIESHRAIGAFDPSLWWLVMHGDKPRGALLMNPCPDLGSTELVYMGIAPSLRGKGVAGALLGRGVRLLERRAHRDVTCAVDARNDPALTLYERSGFAPFSERIALVRRLPDDPGRAPAAGLAR